MGPLLAAAIPAVGNLLGGLFGAKSQHDFSAREAQRQRDFEERMSSTSWQRGVADMRAAGINPLLSFTQGGASSPGGAAASGVAPDLGNVASSAMDALRLRSELRVMLAQKTAAEARAFKDSTRGLVDQQKLYNEATPEAQRQEVGYGLLKAQRALIAAQESSARSVAALNQADLPARRITGGKWAGIVRGFVSPLAGSARAVAGIPF